MKIVEIGKNSIGAEKLQQLGLPNVSKSRLYLLFLFREKYDYFLQYLGYFAKKEDGATSQRARESKFDKTHFIHTTPVNFL